MMNEWIQWWVPKIKNLNLLSYIVFFFWNCTSIAEVSIHCVPFPEFRAVTHTSPASLWSCRVILQPHSHMMGLLNWNVPGLSWLAPVCWLLPGVKLIFQDEGKTQTTWTGCSWMMKCSTCTQKQELWKHQSKITEVSLLCFHLLTDYCSPLGTWLIIKYLQHQ